MGDLLEVLAADYNVVEISGKEFKVSQLKLKEIVEVEAYIKDKVRQEAKEIATDAELEGTDLAEFIHNKINAVSYFNAIGDPSKSPIIAYYSIKKHQPDLSYDDFIEMTSIEDIVTIAQTIVKGNEPKNGKGQAKKNK